jgi:hypothetical protein
MQSIEYDRSIHSNPDAAAWAKLFMQTWEELGKPKPDEAWMISWFANAMMAMHDHLIPGSAPVVLPDGSAVVLGDIHDSN